MKTLAKLMALCLLLGAFGFAQAAPDSKKDDSPKAKKSNSSGTNSKGAAEAKNAAGRNSPGTATTGTKANPTKNVMLTSSDCDQLGGTVTDDGICESGKMCTIKVYDSKSPQGYTTKQRCLSVKRE